MQCLTPTIIKNPDFPAKSRDRYIPVPCSKCPNCRKRRAQQWSFRLKKELERSISSYFITLTYSDENVVYGDCGPTLCTRDLQLFWKRLRKVSRDSVKYYAVGEYGSRSGRPHYHAIVFGLSSPDYVYSCWTLGLVHVGKVTMASISYVTGYVMKPSPTLSLEREGWIERSKAYISKGLGDNYLSDAMVKYHKADLDRQYVTLPGNQKVSMPRYYREKMYDEKELRVLKIRLKRASKERAKELISDWLRENPGKDYDRHSWESVRAALSIDARRQKSNRLKV